ncbi:rhombosortase [Hydrocarboniphaga sp.]|uniref:rhombosortase n=1 Tax=Hydrocarboniphaga sp. TaxID=2033016 RepID=UPI00263473C2|nr:rhombosortase [Hydrocarboniphaga sp.]
MRDLLCYQRTAIAAGQWWRLLTGNFVHLGWYHLFLNELGLIVLVLLCPERLSLWVLARRVVLIGLAMSLCLYAFVPGLHSYVGMSGVIHGLFVLGLLPQLRRRDLVSLGCLIFLLGKLGYEQLAGAPVSDEAAIGGSVITDAHFFGAIAALVYALIFGNWRGGPERGARAPATASEPAAGRA